MNENTLNTPNRNDIEERQLEQIAGGTDGRATKKIGDLVFSGHVTKYNAIPGHKYYITKDGGSGIWYMGVLLKTWEESNYIFFTKRMHRFSIMLECGKTHCFVTDFCGDDYTLYTECSGY